MRIPGVCLLAAAALGAQPASPTIAITRVTAINVTSGLSDRDMTIVIRNGRIAEVARTSAVKIPAGALVVDGAGKYAIPGLWDMHAHRVPDTISLYLANGVTGLRSMNDNLDAVKTTRDRIAAGELTGPRIFFCGPFVDGPQRPRPQAIAVTTADEGRAAVIQLKQKGVDFIKVYTDLSREAYFAVADEANKQHIPFAGHVPIRIGAEEATDAGQKSLEHLTGILLACSRDSSARTAQALIDSYDPEKAKALFAKFVRNGTWIDPTFAVLRVHAFWNDPETLRNARTEYVPRQVREAWKTSPFAKLMESIPPAAVEGQRKLFDRHLQLVGNMHRAGVRILAGTDSSIPYVIQGFSLHDELGWLVKAGLSPLEALRSATIRPAEYFDIADTAGSIAKGKFADLVLLNADPLRDIANTRKIEAVVAAGHYLRRAELDEMLETLKKK